MASKLIHFVANDEPYERELMRLDHGQDAWWWSWTVPACKVTYWSYGQPQQAKVTTKPELVTCMACGHHAGSP